MAGISMTTFVDFVLASGTPRLSVVRKAKAQYEGKYNPGTDFYRDLREAISIGHQQGSPASELDKLALNIENPRKIDLYLECIDSYKRWCGRKTLQWLGTFINEWSFGYLIIRVNPELGLQINGDSYAIKLYFKSDKPSKLRLETMFHLLRVSLPEGQENTTPAILDVRRGKFFTPTRDIPGIQTLLEGEAAAFQTMWSQV